MEVSEMGKVYQGTLELIGNTPLVEFVNIEKNLALRQRFWRSLNILTRLAQSRIVLQRR